MRAVIIHAPKDLRIEAVEAPAMGPNDVRVRIEAGGICGSDLHYYQHGGFGTVRIKEPMILGHEIAGRIEAVGGAVDRVKTGAKVAVNPSRPCGACAYCQKGQQNHCLDMRFFGSAMRFPHVQGAFRQVMVVDQSQVHQVPDDVPMSAAAFAEPLAVCLHAARRAGPLLGKRVLVTGAGPIGCLAILVARRAGAAEIIVTDLAEAPLQMANRMGADVTINVAGSNDGLDVYKKGKGTFDVLLEASGSERALASALELLKPGGVIVQIGIAPSTFNIPINMLVAKELELRGTFRFHEEFQLAVELIGRRRIDVAPLLTATLPFESAREAFELAADRGRAMKVQLTFA